MRACHRRRKQYHHAPSNAASIAAPKQSGVRAYLWTEKYNPAPTAKVAAKFVNKYDRNATSRIFIVKLGSVALSVRHWLDPYFAGVSGGTGGGLLQGPYLAAIDIDVCAGNEPGAFGD